MEAGMSDRPARKAYEGESITVTFQARRCLHATECVRGLPEVFDTAVRPWIRPDGAAADRGRCRSRRPTTSTSSPPSGRPWPAAGPRG
ncbi:(4Fe-4S)-binding protein [Streptomyces sp. NPDC059866]|uniref:(4Fe-4S)-binding protein n=1 Tax=Streptomyces sp. NPDC059866 TaxID=3346978 RepID=UPI003664F416